MTNSPAVRSVIAQHALELAPPLLRQELIDDANFRDEYSLGTDASLSVGGINASFKRSALFSAVRKAFSTLVETSAVDLENREWMLRPEDSSDGRRVLKISRGDLSALLPDFSPLATDRELRLRNLEINATTYNLPREAREEWYRKLTERALDDDEIERFHLDFGNTPFRVAKSIAAVINGGESGIASLVPNARTYFERLVGKYDGSSTIGEYAQRVVKRHLKQMSEWHPKEGFLFSLMLSSHTSLTDEIEVAHFDPSDLEAAYEEVVQIGDKVSQLGAIDVGLRMFPERPELERHLCLLVEEIRGDDPQEEESGFRLLTALFVLVDGELSRSRLLSDTPPFYRRLASLAHAALIQREVNRARVISDTFYDWAMSNRGEWFMLQSFVDMRSEPRWYPDLVNERQLRAEFLGRIAIATSRYKKNIPHGQLHDILFGGEQTGHGKVELPIEAYFPGPLEGEEVPSRQLPDEAVETITGQLQAAEIEPSSFVTLVNSILISHVGTEQADLAARALKMGNYHLTNVGDKSQLVSILYGLAQVAAVERSNNLADELKVLIRRYRHDPQFSLTIEEALRIGLVAAASRSEESEWIDFVGGWLVELAFADFEDGEAEALKSHLECLLQSVPNLWTSCAKAEAALASFNAV